MATINDKISTVKPDSTHNPVVATVSSNRTIGASSLSCTALDYWPDVAHFITYKKKSDGSKDNSTVSSWKALRSGNTLSSMTLLAGTDAGHDTSYYVEAAPTAGWAEDVIKGLQTSLNADGSLKANTIDTAQIKAGAVTTNTLADSAVTPGKVNMATFPQIQTYTSNSTAGNHTLYYVKHLNGQIEAWGMTPNALIGTSIVAINIPLPPGLFSTVPVATVSPTKMTVTAICESSVNDISKTSLSAYLYGHGAGATAAVSYQLFGQ